MDWTPVVFAVVSVALIVWAGVGLWISTFRRDRPSSAAPSKDPGAHSTPPPALEILELLRELVPSAGERERLWSRVDAQERRASVHSIDYQALAKRLTALDDRVNALKLAVKALRERVEERGESSDEESRSELADLGRARARRGRGGARGGRRAGLDRGGGSSKIETADPSDR